MTICSDSKNKASSIHKIEASFQGKSYVSQRQQEIYDISNQLVGTSTITPSVYIQDKINDFREQILTLSLSERYKRLKIAAQLYQEAILATLNAENYITLVSKITGLEKSIIANSMDYISYNLSHMTEVLTASKPAGAVWDINDPVVNNGCSLFSRRGSILTVITAGNGPGVHSLWPQAIAMGYKTLVKPSSKEPFTAQRLVCALEQAGLEKYVALIPTDHKGIETLISESDLAIIYGGPEIVSQYRGNPKILVQGPGRSKLIIGKDISHDEAIEVAVQSVSLRGGAACVCASAILVEEAPYEFAQKLQEQLEIRYQNQIFTLGSLQEAEIYEKMLETDIPRWQYDRSASHGYPLKPHVTFVNSASDPKVQRELPFPCVTVAPFNSEKICYQSLSGSLAITILSRQQDLINKILSDSSIANVYIGNIPTTWMDYRVPHDGYLSDFLMRNRGLKITPGWLKEDFQSSF